MNAIDTTSVYMVASGDLRLAANQRCWAAQEEMEQRLGIALQSLGCAVTRAHSYNAEKQHGFLDSQRYGMEVFSGIPPEAPVVVAEAVWQYTHHVLPGLTRHRGPVLTVANWSGQWPGLVGLLNLNGSLTKAGIPYSTLWSRAFDDRFFLDKLEEWLRTGFIHHDVSHVQPYVPGAEPSAAEQTGVEVAHSLQRRQAILGVFDEGCMGMYNAILPDALLHPMGIFKERLSQSSLFYEVTQTSDAEAREAYTWLRKRGMRFELGKDEATELTEAQVLEQCKMYIAALRVADDFGCDAIGIQYQQGLKDLLPASDLAEGLLNNVERPTVRSRDGSRELYPGAALPHFNEVDECAGVDALVTNRIWTRMGMAPETTLHDLRYGEEYDGEFVWVLEISGAAPPAHFTGGFRGTISKRQPSMYFRRGGGGLQGWSRPGNVVWSRVFVEDGRLKADLGLARCVALPEAEMQRRSQATTPQWPIMSAVFPGITRDQMMARHKANHIQVAYAPGEQEARDALMAKCACFRAMGMEVFVCGQAALGRGA
jgi:L-fucose isomerase-like protein